LSQELRLSSNFNGPFNFSVGGNYMHYETEENYYVFFNTLTMFAAVDGLSGRRFPWDPYSPSPNQQCLQGGRQYTNINQAQSASGCLGYIDPNPLSSVNNDGHNYFLSQNPYNLNSYAAFGEAYYNVTPELKLTAGLRFTDDQKHFVEIPSELLTQGYGYPITGVIDQEWTEWTGRFVANWSPKVSFTDQTMLYASYAHGYKAGGANPPGAVLLSYASGDITNPTHPKTFDPEFNDAFEIGTKNTMLNGAITLNGDVFYYDYKGYQISQIVDRTAINLNFNATSMGAELEATWEPVPGLKFGFNGGYEHTRLADGSQAIDLMDRTAGNPNWVLVKPFVTQASNCVVPAYAVGYPLNPAFRDPWGVSSTCGQAYSSHLDPVTGNQYTAYPTTGTGPGGGSFPIDPSYPGFDPLAGTPGDPYHGQNTYNGVDYGPVPNAGAGFYKNLSGNELPNAPHYTMSLTADYTIPVTPDWAATLHTDFYWQSQSWARVFNDDPYDRIRGYTNLNLALILNDSTGWQVMGYLKNVFDNTAITGSFLNSDDTGLTTNIFLTDPRLFGVRVTKRFGEGSWDDGGGLDFINDLFTDSDGGKPRVWLTVGGNFNNVVAANNESYVPDYIRPGGAPLLIGLISRQPAGSAPAGTETMTQLMEASGFGSPSSYQKTPSSGFDWQAQVEFQPADSDWVLKAGIRYGRSGRKQLAHKSEIPGTKTKGRPFPSYPSYPCTISSFFPHYDVCHSGVNRKFIDAQGNQREQHTIMDFEAGVNIGIGMFGKEGQGNISAGLRVAQFKSDGHMDVNSDAEYVFNPLMQYHDVYESRGNADRSFHGMGPEVTWEASQPFWGTPENGQFTIDWGANAGLLFGRQSMNASHFSSYCHENFSNEIRGCVTAVNYGPGHSKVKTTRRTRRKVVPNLGGYIGASARYNNAKISFGYRADTFFGAMDGGQATAKDYNRGFYGPYMNVSIGLGG
jgi:outer membrane receptor protein involved in Fe transport